MRVDSISEGQVFRLDLLSNFDGTRARLHGWFLEIGRLWVSLTIPLHNYLLGGQTWSAEHPEDLRAFRGEHEDIH